MKNLTFSFLLFFLPLIGMAQSAFANLPKMSPSSADRLQKIDAFIQYYL